ncbi:hypothetical protein HanRHA438_Chr12g0551711 [Helianthus annuus]|nr:hypothetical protein HanRHA438_Chr12g0551711 [Helianthus annuus]
MKIECQVPIPEDCVISTSQAAIPAYRKGESEYEFNANESVQRARYHSWKRL